MRALKKRTLAIALTLVMVIALVPAAFAANADDFLKAAFIEEDGSLTGFTLTFKGAHEELLTSDLTELGIAFGAVTMEIDINEEVEKTSVPAEGDTEEQTVFSVSFVDPLGGEGTYTLTGKYKTKEFTAEITIAPPAPVEEPSSWAKEGVDSLKAIGVIPAELLSAYTSNIRRDEFTALIWNVYVYAKGDLEATPAEKFTDIADSKYKEQILKANSVGIINGRSDTTFDPAGILDREQMAIIINNLVKAVEGVEIPEDVKATAFADNAEITSWAVFHVAYCAEQGFMNGVGNNVFAPKRILTRETAFVGVNNVIGKFPTWGADKEAE